MPSGVKNPRVPGWGRPEPPDLPDDEAKIWRRIVEAMPDGWFGPQVQPVLKCLVSHIATTEMLTRRIAAHRAKSNMEALARETLNLERESKAVGDLSTKLRLTPQTKWGNQEKASTAMLQSPKKRPWDAKAA